MISSLTAQVAISKTLRRSGSARSPRLIAPD